MANSVKTPTPPGSQQDMAAIKQPAKIGTFYSLTLRNFRLLWIGSLFSNFSQWVQSTTLSAVVYNMTGSGTLLQTINGIRSLPNLVIAPVSGLVADRVDRRKLMIYTQLPLLAMTLIMGILFAFGVVKVWHLMVFAILSGIPGAVNQPVRSSVTPMIVPRFAMPNAVALNSGVFTFTRIIGPAAAGVMLALSPATNFFIQSSAYALVMLTIYMTVIPNINRGPKKASLKADFAEGFRYCVKNKAVRVLMVMGTFNPILVTPFQALLVIFAKEDFHMGSAGFGYLLAASGGGAVIGAVVIASLNTFEKRGMIQLSGMIVWGALVVLFTLVHAFWLAILVMMAIGAFQLVFIATNQAMIQLSVPSKMMGRVTGIMAVQQGVLPVGSILIGVLTDVIGHKDTTIFIGTLSLILGLVLLAIPKIRNMGPTSAMQAQKEAEAAMGLAPSS